MQQKSNVSLDGVWRYDPGTITNSEVIAAGLSLLVDVCHHNSYNRGWWHDPLTGESLIPGDHGGVSHPIDQVVKAWFPYVIATKIALIHSEVSEGLEAYRTDAMDDKIPFPGITAEMGDAVIRIADLMGCLQWYYTQEAAPGYAAHTMVKEAFDLGAAILAKLPVNVGRLDHGLEARKKPGGKKF